MDFSTILKSAMPTQVTDDLTDLKEQTADAVDIGKKYLVVQFALQVVSTAAIVGMFILAYKANKRR